MSKQGHSYPNPDAKHPISERLERVRAHVGIESKRAFHRALCDGWEDPVSYEAVRNYHYNREPPPSYLARVAERFNVRIAYLVTGEKPMTEAEKAVEDGVSDPAIWGERAYRRIEGEAPPPDRPDPDEPFEADYSRRAVMGGQINRAVGNLLRRVARASPSDADPPTRGEAGALLALVSKLAEIPLEAFAGESDLGSYGHEDYTTAIYHALSLAVPPPGQGRPVEDVLDSFWKALDFERDDKPWKEGNADE